MFLKKMYWSFVETMSYEIPENDINALFYEYIPAEVIGGNHTHYNIT